MNDLILEYYEPLTYFAYFVLFLVNFVSIFAYFKNRMDNTNKILVFDFFYIFCGIAFILLERYYTLFCMRTNIDESFHLGIALKFISGDHFWTDIDPSSVGPLNTLLFSVMYLFTGEMSYFTAKLTTMFVICASFVLLYLSFVKIIHRVIACLVTTCFAIHFCIPDGPTTISYNSEIILLLLLSLWLFLYVHSINNNKIWNYYEFFVIGLMPFGKLQFAPVALFLFVFRLIFIVKKQDNALSSKVKSVFYLSLCCSIPSVIVLLDAIIHNGLLWFIRFYFVNMISYMNVEHLGNGVNSYSMMLLNLIKFWSSYFHLYVITSLDFILIFLCLIKKIYKVALFCFFLIVLSAFEVVKPLFDFSHYTNIMIIPLFASIVLLLNRLQSRNINILTIIVTICFMGYYFNNFDRDFKFKTYYVQETGISPVWMVIAKDIKAMSNKNDRLVVWGWMDELYVLTGLPSGTAEIAIGGFVPHQLVNRVYPDYTKHKYIDDIINNRPRFIIDTPSPITGIYNSYDYSLKNYPEFWNVINKHYHLVKEYSFANNPNDCDNNLETCIKIPLYEINAGTEG